MKNGSKQPPKNLQVPQASFDFNAAAAAPQATGKVIPFPTRSVSNARAELEEQAGFIEKLLAKAKLVDWG